MIIHRINILSFFKKYFFLFIALALLLLFALWVTAYFIWSASPHQGEIATLGVSSDGKYAISVDNKNVAVLWNLEEHSKKILSTEGNMNSAYWIKDTPYFMWQEIGKKIIHVQNVNTGQNKFLFHSDFLVYGEAMSTDLEYDIISDENWNIYFNKPKLHVLHVLIPHYNDVPGGEKLINFTFVNNHQVLLSGFTGYDEKDIQGSEGSQLWDLNTRKKVQEYFGTQMKTFATVSPDGQYVVAGDEGIGGYVWETQTGKKLFRLDDIFLGRWHPHPDKPFDASKAFDASVLHVKVPADFGDGDAANRGILSLKFIDASHYLCFPHSDNSGHPYAILYSITDPAPLNYLSLGSHPEPVREYYARDQAIDTAPSANVLVMAKEKAPGILVYHYNAQSQTLEKVWDSTPALFRPLAPLVDVLTLKNYQHFVDSWNLSGLQLGLPAAFVSLVLGLCIMLFPLRIRVPLYSTTLALLIIFIYSNGLYFGEEIGSLFTLGQIFNTITTSLVLGRFIFVTSKRLDRKNKENASAQKNE